MRVGHQAAHAHQLTHLRHVAPGAGVGHHPHGIEWIVLIEIAPYRRHQALVGFSPGVDHFGVTFHLGDFPQPVALFCFGNLLLRLSQQSRLVTWNAQVVYRNRYGGLGGIAETEILEVVGHGGRDGGAVVLIGPGHQVSERFFVHHPIAKWRRLLAQGHVHRGDRRGGGGAGGSLGGLGLFAGFLGGGGGHGGRIRWRRGFQAICRLVGQNLRLAGISVIRPLFQLEALS